MTGRQVRSIRFKSGCRFAATNRGDDQTGIADGRDRSLLNFIEFDGKARHVKAIAISALAFDVSRYTRGTVEAEEQG